MKPWEMDWNAKAAPFSFDSALAAEGVTGKLADIARSIYTQESSAGKNTKTSNAGAVGGMQIVPATFASVADKDWNINDETQNARAGIRYLKQMFDQAGGDPALTAAGYYGGPGGLEKARRGVAVKDPRNPSAPNTLQYGAQVASRLPKEKSLLQRGVEAVIPSAEASEAAPKPWERAWDVEQPTAAPVATPAAAPAPAAAPKDQRGIGSKVLSAAMGAVSPVNAIADAMTGGQFSKDVGAGLLRGAGSIGATIMAPVDMATDAIKGDRRPNVSGLVTGQQPLSRNQERRQDMDAALREMGANPESLAFQGGKLGGEIAGTAGIGSAVAIPVRAGGNAIASFAPAAGNVVTKVGNAIASGGMTVGGAPATTLAGSAGNTLARVVGGGISGGVSAGAVNPEDALTGAKYGAAIPGVASLVAPVGRSIGSRLAQRATERATSFARNAPLRETLQEGVAAGYVVPPSSVSPTLYNTVKESISGKIATAQVASTRNQEVTDKLVRRALGLAEDAPLSTEALRAYRKAEVATGYDPLRNLGVVPADTQFATDLTNVIKNNTGKGTIPAIENNEIKNLANAHRSQGFDAGDAIDAIRQLRENAQDAYRKGETALGAANKQIANAYEAALERAIPKNQPSVLAEYQKARANIARSFSVEDALKEGTGAVDARKLAAQLQKDTPLDGDLLTVARFASAFPKATQPPSLVAGAGVHNLKSYASSGGAVLGTLGGGPVVGGLMAAAPWVVPPALRAQMFSGRAQRALIPQAPNAGGNRLLEFARSPEAQQLIYRTAPVIGSQSP